MFYYPSRFPYCNIRRYYTASNPPAVPWKHHNKSRFLKLRYYEKATKFEKISHRSWKNSCFYSVVSKQVGGFFKFLWPFRQSWTLSQVEKLWVKLFLKGQVFCLILFQNTRILSLFPILANEKFIDPDFFKKKYEVYFPKIKPAKIFTFSNNGSYN